MTTKSPTDICPSCSTDIPKGMKSCPGCKVSLVPIKDQINTLANALGELPLEERKQVLSCRDGLMAIARDLDHLGLLALGLATVELDRELQFELGGSEDA